MTEKQLVDITYDNSHVPIDENALAAEVVVPDRSAHWDDIFTPAQKSRLLRYGIAVSLILHVLAFTVVPRMAAFQPSNAALKPGEKKTPVRLVQLPEMPKKEEPPPKHADAISDRDHTAKKERLPKAIPAPQRAPIGSIEPPKRMAALTPPPAPEAIVKEPEPREKPKASTPKPTREKEAKAQPPKPQTQTTRERKKHDLKHLKVDPRLTPEDMKKGFSAQTAGSPDFYPDGEVEEAVVDINTREDRFFSYLLGLKHKIEGVWVYPKSAARAGIGGSLTLEFVIAKDGKLEAVNLLDTSGHTILDQSALSAIKNAAPYYPFPPSLKAKRLRIRANFIYVTSDFFRRIL